MISNRAKYEFNNMNGISKKHNLGNILTNAGNLFPSQDTYFVDSTNGEDDASVTGSTWDDSFASITYALTRAGDFDVIVLSENIMYSTTGETFPLQITQAGLKIIGSNQSMNHNKSLIYNNSDDEAVFEILANEVEISNVSITQGKAYDVIIIGAAANAGGGIYKFRLSDSRIDGYGAGKTAVASYATTVDAPDLHIERCLFRGLTDHAIEPNWTRSMINDCIIYTVAAKAGINHIPNAGDRPASVYARNVIIGVNSTDTGILLTGTPTAGLLCAYDNYIFNCATTITQDAGNVAVQMNYESDGAGGALIDPIA